LDRSAAINLVAFFRYLDEASSKHTLQRSAPFAMGFPGLANKWLFRQPVEWRTLITTTSWTAGVSFVMDGVITSQELPASADAAYSHKYTIIAAVAVPSTRIPNV